MPTLKQHNTKDGKVRVWSIWADGGEVHVEYGTEGGKLQHAVDVPGSVGREGTKAFVDPSAQALLVVERLVKKKSEEGYVEEGATAVDTLNIRAPLPKNLSLPKPVKIFPVDRFTKTYGEVSDFDFCFTRKRDGMMAVLASHGSEPRLYSRRMDDMGNHVPHILEEAASWLPPDTLLTGELISTDPADDFRYVSRVVRSLPEKAVDLQNDCGKLAFYIFGVFVWNGEEVWKTENMEKLLARIGRIPESEHIRQVELIGVDDLKQLKAVIKGEEWEGAVIHLREGLMPKDALSFAGKERRPPVSWKFKVAREDDFVILNWDVGSGKNMTRLGSVLLGKYSGEAPVEFGWCGTGFTDAQREEYASDSLIGRVVQVEYDSITPDGKLRFPKFIRFRPDKDPEECITDEGSGTADD